VRLGRREAPLSWDSAATAPLNYFLRSLSFRDFVPNPILQWPKSWLPEWPEVCSSLSPPSLSSVLVCLSEDIANPTQLRRDHPVDCGSHRYAVAGKSETEGGNSSCECVIESRCNRIRSLWLLVTDRFGRTFGKPDLSRAVVRPDRGLGPRAAHHPGKDGKPSTLRDTAVTDPRFEPLGLCCEFAYVKIATDRGPIDSNPPPDGALKTSELRTSRAKLQLVRHPVGADSMPRRQTASLREPNQRRLWRGPFPRKLQSETARRGASVP
jgi:hypothetical protein